MEEFFYDCVGSSFHEKLPETSSASSLNFSNCQIPNKSDAKDTQLSVANE
jgi:hypothetical protein